MKSLYFDDSLYENDMHYQIYNILMSDEFQEPGSVSFKVDANNVDAYNLMLDDITHAASDKLSMSCVSYNPMEIVIEDDPRDKYRKFNEDFLEQDEEEVE